MTVVMFGEETELLLARQGDLLEVICETREAQMLVDACDIQEPLWVDGHCCLIAYVDVLEQEFDYVYRDGIILDQMTRLSLILEEI